MANTRPAGRRAGPVALALGLAVLSLAVASNPAVAQVDREALAQRVAEEFQAEVIQVREGTLDGRAVLYVTLMHEGGNSNAAFKVDTLAFDAETGEPLRGAMPATRGSEGLSSMRTGMTEKRPDVLRGRPWR